LPPVGLGAAGVGAGVDVGAGAGVLGVTGVAGGADADGVAELGEGSGPPVARSPRCARPRRSPRRARSIVTTGVAAATATVPTDAGASARLAAPAVAGVGTTSD
jgi:hypothetical protein